MKKAWLFLLIFLLSVSLCLSVFAADDGQEDRLLTLVNPWNTIPSGWTVDLVHIGSGHRVDRICYDDLMAMMEACRAEGLSPVVRSSYRTQSQQEQLYANKINQWKATGLSDAEARNVAATIVAPPGTSEHQMGWAVDIVDNSYRTLDERQAETAAQQWLMAHSWEYGFILRYPVDKSEVTGIIYEPWHYRYVGRDNAKAIYGSCLCLEEYLELQARQNTMLEQVKAALDSLLGDTSRSIFRLMTRKDGGLGTAVENADVMKP